MKRVELQRFGVESLLVSLVVSFLILISSVIGWILVEQYYSFYLALFFILLIPLWLAAFGLVFHAKWKWYSLLIGSSLSVFFLSLAFFATAEDWEFRFLNSLMFAGIGAVCVMWGWAIGRLFASLCADFSARKKGKQRSKDPAAPLGL